jgi:hypothetical protein
LCLFCFALSQYQTLTQQKLLKQFNKSNKSGVANSNKNDNTNNDDDDGNRNVNDANADDDDGGGDKERRTKLPGGLRRSLSWDSNLSNAAAAAASTTTSVVVGAHAELASRHKDEQCQQSSHNNDIFHFICPLTKCLLKGCPTKSNNFRD